MLTEGKMNLLLLLLLLLYRSLAASTALMLQG